MKAFGAALILPFTLIVTAFASEPAAAQRMVVPMVKTSWGSAVSVNEGSRLRIRPDPRLKVAKLWQVRILRTTKDSMMKSFNPQDTTCDEFLSAVYQFEYSVDTHDVIGFVPDFGWLQPAKDGSYLERKYVVVLEEKIPSDANGAFLQVLRLRHSVIEDYLKLAAELTVLPAYKGVRAAGFGPGPLPIPEKIRLECIQSVEQRPAAADLAMLAACSNQQRFSGG